jgi:hypothetical protein
MINEMSRTGIFNAVPITETERSGRGGTGYEWVLRVSYVQRSRRAAQPAAAGDAGASARVVTRRNDLETGGRE